MYLTHITKDMFEIIVPLFLANIYSLVIINRIKNIV